MPITRHLLLAMYLFGTRDQFDASLRRLPADEKLLLQATPAVEGSEHLIESLPSSPRATHRRRIRNELARNPDMKIEDPWRRAYRVTSWLYDHDRTWLLEALLLPSAAATHGTSAAIIVSPEDDRLAALIDATAAALLVQSGKPQQVTKERLLAALPLRIADTPRYRERYPRTLGRVTENRESTWHFRARRVWWAYEVLSARGDVLSANEAAILSGVGYHAVLAIVEHCRWAPILPRATRFDVMGKLEDLGVTRKWDGPPAWIGRAIGGRSYRRRTFEL
jgi:hypothetical protein